MNLVPKNNSYIALSNEALVLLPTAIAVAHQHADLCYDQAMNRRRTFFGSLFTPLQHDEFVERLRGIAKAAGALTSYIVHRAGYKKSAEADFTIKLALIREHQQLIRDVIESGNRLGSLPPSENPALFRSMDERTNYLNELDAQALFLIETHNDLVDSLKQFRSQHKFSIPRDQGIPGKIYLGPD